MSLVVGLGLENNSFGSFVFVFFLLKEGHGVSYLFCSSFHPSYVIVI